MNYRANRAGSVGAFTATLLTKDRNGEGAGQRCTARRCATERSEFYGVYALTVSLGGADLQAQFFIQVAADKATDAVSLPARDTHDGLESGALRLSQQRNHPGRLGVC